jgi:hypothetical protein
MTALRAAVISALMLLALPALATARTPQPLVDAAPLGIHFKDKVTSTSARVAHAAIAGKWFSYPIKDGATVAAAISDQYGTSLNTHVVQTYVDFLDSLEHGPELSELRIYIAPPTEVLSECGGLEGTLACYDSGTKIMVVPGEQTDTGSSGVTTSYVVAHEYGHHIAAVRSNDPFRSFTFGPKYWASYERVCDRTLHSLLAPGNEGEFYRSNPGEGWAETYARLKYPDVEWQFDPIMQPDDGAYEAARKDVLNPWQAGLTQTFKGSFSKRGAKTKRFSFELNLDGRMQVRLKGPRKSNYNFTITSNGRSQGKTTNAGSRDSVNYAAACREDQLEHVTVAVKRVSGSGPFTLRADYAG